jgi:hypothetical protein
MMLPCTQAIAPIYLADPLGCISVFWRDLDGRARKQLDEIGDKCAAKILLTDRTSHLILPDPAEWYGINLLERDDEL